MARQFKKQFLLSWAPLLLQGKHVHSGNEMGRVTMATGYPWMRTSPSACLFGVGLNKVDGVGGLWHQIECASCLRSADESKCLMQNRFTRCSLIYRLCVFAGCFITRKNAVSALKGLCLCGAFFYSWACFLICVVLRTCVCVCVAGGDAGCGDLGYATGLHLTVSRSE